MCLNLKSIKVMKNILCICRPITFEDCGEFLGKVTREKQVMGKKNHPSINKLSLDFFLFKFRHLCLYFEARSCNELCE